ncbi:MAG: helix-turn-helix transcriptional regulator [Bacteroidales bacterium]|nr:helix-turn-helix transcriptional regulator [Bacteroidales bacterium]
MESVKIHKNFGEHLRTLRETAGLTLREVASTINVDSSLLAKVERNQRPPTRQLIKSLASFFNTNERELLIEFLSDQIAYKILDEEGDLDILKVAEEKVSYLKTLHNGNDNDKK